MSSDFSLVSQLFYDEGRYHIETSPSICSANQLTGFYMISTSVMKELKNITFISLCELWLNFFHFLSIYSSVFLGACRSSRLIFYLNCVSCFESHWYSTFNFYKNHFYLPSFSYFLQGLIFIYDACF